MSLLTGTLDGNAQQASRFLLDSVAIKGKPGSI